MGGVGKLCGDVGSVRRGRRSPRQLIRILARLLERVIFFSSRRRHTRFDCDWSSDVCSSDLGSLSTASEAVVVRADQIPSPPKPSFGSVTRRAIMEAYRIDRFGSVGGIVLQSSRSEEHTSELQSQSNLVCRLLLEKKKNTH